MPQLCKNEAMRGNHLLGRYQPHLSTIRKKYSGLLLQIERKDSKVTIPETQETQKHHMPESQAESPLIPPILCSRNTSLPKRRESMALPPVKGHFHHLRSKGGKNFLEPMCRAQAFKTNDEA